MNKARKMNLNYETLAWGALLVWWGIRWLFEFLPNGTGLLGTGLILLGVNTARWAKGIPINSSNTPVAVVAIVWGSLDHLLQLSFGASTATLLIVIGLVAIASLVTYPKPA